MKNEEHTVPTAQLAAAIEAMLETGPCIIEEIAKALGYSTGAVRVRLLQLMQAGRAHRRRICLDNNPALYYRWHSGPGDTDLEAIRGDVGDLSPVQLTVRAYPAVNRRDPLVAAFFGQYGVCVDDTRRRVPA